MRQMYDITAFGAVSGKTELQTAALQAALDACKETGGTVVIPKGVFCIGGVMMHSGTTLLLKSGAVLLGSTDCNDYPVFPVPQGVVMRSDMEMITAYYHYQPWEEYRRAMISAYGAKDIAIIGEPGSLIDGQDCFDPAGEEGLRGPHGIYLTNCQNVQMRGYTIQNSGNFMHQLDVCTNVDMRNVTCLAGHDGIHLHCCEHVLMEDCDFMTGDDCVAGINMKDIVLRRSRLNTSCDLFRIGGRDILVEDCRMWGPGYYPHRMTVVQKDGSCLPREAGRHNCLFVVEYFSSMHHPAKEPAGNILFRNCSIENVDRFLHYDGTGENVLHRGTALSDISLENVRFTGLDAPSDLTGHAETPLTVNMENVTVTYRGGKENEGLMGPLPQNIFVNEK